MSRAISRPILTCVPWTTEPGGDWQKMAPIFTGSLACPNPVLAMSKTVNPIAKLFHMPLA
jgi:hypothetical protein